MTEIAHEETGRGVPPKPRAAPSDPAVAAVIVTYNRAAVFPAAIEGVAAQSLPPAEIILVDNASGDGTEEVVRRRFPGITYIRMPENLGFAAGLAAGMERAMSRGHDYCLLLDDDSVPAPDVLRSSVDVARRVPGAGVVGLHGGDWQGAPRHWWGPEYPARAAVAGVADVYRCDFVLVDGALVARDAIRAVGYPRGDYFMMMEDMEYTTRIKRTGFEVLLNRTTTIDRGHLGSGAHTSQGPPWRGYYQTRNHLAMALERKSGSELAWWAYRQAKLCVGTLLHADRKVLRIGLRARGAVDALRGRMGRTIEPTAYA